MGAGRLLLMRFERGRRGRQEMSFQLKAISVMVAAGLLLFLGTGTASATVLCGNKETTKCAAPFGVGTTLKASAIVTTVIHTPFKTIECKKSTLVGKTKNQSGVSVEGTIDELTYAECNCTVNVLKNGTFGIFNNAGTDNGGFVTTGTEITVNCSSPFGTIHCIYLTNSTELGTVIGGNPAKIVMEATLPAVVTNALCPEERTLTAEYEVTSPNPLYVGAS
jgi:hypothetical protein